MISGAFWSCFLDERVDLRANYSTWRPDIPHRCYESYISNIFVRLPESTICLPMSLANIFPVPTHKELDALVAGYFSP